MSSSGVVSNGNSGGSSSSYNSEKDKIWYFSAEQLTNSPSRRCGIKPDQELSYRQLTAYLIQEMGQRLQVSQLCINTAIVYMHRFYAFHSFTHFHRNSIAAASLFLAAKVEEQPRKLEHVIKAANKCLPQSADVNYAEQAQDLVFNENVLLQTLGFDVAIDHPHTHVVKTCQLVKACKDLAQTSYFLASNSLHLTSMCLQYRPTVVACFCIYLACKWSRWEIPQSTEGKHWFYYVDKSVTLDLLKKLTDEFIAIYEKSPTRLQSKLNSIKAIAQGASNRGSKDKAKEEFKMGDIMKGYHSSINTDSNSNGAFSSCSDNSQPQTSSSALLPPPSQPLVQQPIRKPEIHSSQHRLPHGSSSVSGSHHHSKPAYPNDALADHKSKQSSGYGSNIVNRSTSNHQSASVSSSVQRTNAPSSSNRPSSSSNLSSQRPSQTHPMDYHKSSSSRDRNGINVMTGASHGIAPLHTVHKMAHKQQDSSNNGRSSSSKDTLSRMSEPTSKQPGNKIYPSGAPTFGSNQLPPPPQQSGKMDDSSRNLMHNQRGYIPTSGGSVGQPPNSYHHHRSGNLTGGNSLTNSSNISSNSSKSSVHSIPHAPYDQLPPPYASQSHQQSVSTGYCNVRGGVPELQTQVDDSTHSHSSLHQLMTQQPPSQSKNSSASTSLFSPDWKDKQQSQQLLNGLSSHDALIYKLNVSNRDKNSPKKERSSSSSTGTPTKRDKSRLLTPSSSISGTSMSIPISLVGTRNDQMQDQQAHLLKSGLPPPRKQDIIPGPPASLNELSASNQIAGGNLKRTNDNTSYLKHDDDTVQRDNKIRKVDSLSSQNTLSLSTFAFPGSIDAATDKHPISMANGMETTPDLVRSLLKESLCTSNALLKPEPLTMPGLKPPAELLDPSAGQSTGLYISGVTANNSTEADAPGADQSSNADDKLDGSKIEKKKKKEKHKHKEKDKDKSKDREERKKHKKDKDKHKDRDRDGENMEHVKLVIPKEKLESSGGDLKIKIGKDRFKSDVGSGGTTTTSAPPNLGTSGLKIKISKDKLEIYNSDGVNAFSTNEQSQKNLTQLQLQSAHMQLGTSHGSGVSNLNPPMSGYGMTMGSISVSGVSGANSSSKKKDRDRDRDKEKKRSSHEFLKYNGNLMSGVLAASTAAPMMPMPPTSLMTTANTSATSSISSASLSYAKK